MRKVFFFFLAIFSLRAEGIIESFVHEEALELNHATYRWCFDEKALAFADLVLETKPDVCVEIGVFGGGSVLPVAVALKALGKGMIIGIDPWNNETAVEHLDPILEPSDYAYWDEFDFSMLPSPYAQLLRLHKLNEYVITLVSSSEKVLPFIPPIDILHIDGMLSEKASMLDVDLYLPRVRKGGYIWLTNPNLRQGAVDVLSLSCELIKVIESGSCALFRKK